MPEKKRPTPKRSEMTKEEVKAFLDWQHVGTLATVRPDGSPHVTPIWYVYDGKQLYITTGNSAVKTRNIRHDSRVSICFAPDAPPYKGVIIEGKAKVTQDKAAVQRYVRELCVKYLGNRTGDKYANELLQYPNSVIISVKPDRVHSWNSSL